MVQPLGRALARQLVVFPKEGRQLQRLEVMGQKEELCLILGDAAWSGGAGFGGVDDGDTIGELDAFDELGQLISPVQPAPGL